MAMYNDQRILILPGLDFKISEVFDRQNQIDAYLIATKQLWNISLVLPRFKWSRVVPVNSVTATDVGGGGEPYYSVQTQAGLYQIIIII